MTSIINCLVQINRDTFLGIFKNLKDIPRAYNIIRLNRFDWNSRKLKKNFRSINETEDFAFDKSRQRSLVWKLNKKSLSF